MPVVRPANFILNVLGISVERYQAIEQQFKGNVSRAATELLADKEFIHFVH
jgi:hypothetical protein